MTGGREVAALSPERKRAALAHLLRARAARRSRFALSCAQQRLWFLDQLEPDGSVFNFPVAVRLVGRLDAGTFARCVDELVRRHEVLRTTFVCVEGEPFQVVVPALRVPVPVTDLATLPRPEREAAVRRLVREEETQPFDLARGPLLRVRLLRLGTEEHVVLAAFHHIVFDGWSTGILFREMGLLYDAFSRGVRSPLPPLPIQYVDYADWQRRHLEDPAVEEALAYWRERLTPPPPDAVLPADRTRPSVPTGRGGERAVRLPGPLDERLRALARAEGATLFMTLLAAFAIQLRHLTGRQDLLVGTDVANRTAGETEGLIGFFVNQLVLRLDVSGEPSFRTLLGRVRDTCVGAYAHQDAPFERLVRDLARERDASRAPLFQVKITQQPPLPPAADVDGLRVQPLDVERTRTQLDLILFVDERDRETRLTFGYATDLFDAGTVERWLAALVSLLETVAERPDGRVADLLDTLVRAEEHARTAHTVARRERAASRLRTIRRRPVVAAAADLVRTELPPGETLPLVVRPAVPDVDPAAWAAAARDFVEEHLARHGALLFRNFPLPSAVAFEALATAVCGELFHDNGEHPRETVTAGVYTPVAYPSDRKLLWHNENSFDRRWPLKILFGCLEPAARGGETPLVDSRRLFASLDPALRAPFLEKGVMYVRNFGAGLGRPWQAIFGTDVRAEVEARCRREGVAFEWGPDGRLSTRAVRPAALRHPKTGETVWFNQAQHWHMACLDADARRSLVALFGEEGAPRGCRYGDGSPIDDATMTAILDAYRALEVTVPWQAGDVLLVDNVLVAHARNPFVGPRRLLVSMGEMRTYDGA